MQNATFDENPHENERIRVILGCAIGFIACTKHRYRGVWLKLCMCTTFINTNPPPQQSCQLLVKLFKIAVWTGENISHLVCPSGQTSAKWWAFCLSLSVNLMLSAVVTPYGATYLGQHSTLAHMVTQIWVNIGSGNGLLPDGTKPLPEPVLSYHHHCQR